MKVFKSIICQRWRPFDVRLQCLSLWKKWMIAKSLTVILVHSCWHVGPHRHAQAHLYWSWYWSYGSLWRCVPLEAKLGLLRAWAGRWRHLLVRSTEKKIARAELVGPYMRWDDVTAILNRHDAPVEVVFTACDNYMEPPWEARKLWNWIHLFTHLTFTQTQLIPNRGLFLPMHSPSMQVPATSRSRQIHQVPCRLLKACQKIILSTLALTLFLFGEQDKGHNQTQFVEIIDSLKGKSSQNIELDSSDLDRLESTTSQSILHIIENSDQTSIWLSFMWRAICMEESWPHCNCKAYMAQTLSNKTIRPETISRHSWNEPRRQSKSWSAEGRKCCFISPVKSPS